jgi:NAD(P)-dependent dehydrogenase (short-subunit alcohol dehydrogenase family)
MSPTSETFRCTKDAEDFIGKFGRIDILCNVAGMAITGGPDENIESFTEMDEKEWDFSIELNLKTTSTPPRPFFRT